MGQCNIVDGVTSMDDHKCTAPVINQVLHRRKPTAGLSPLEIIFLWDLDPWLLFEIL